METIKGFARRATQSAKEKFAHADATNDDRLLETSRKVRQQEKSCSVIIEKIGKMCRVLDEFANVSREIGDEYRMNLDQGSEMCQLAEDCRAFGNEMAQKVQEFQKTLKDGAFEPLSAFMKEIAKLKDYEEDRKKKQLEFDFFRTKVAELRRNPPKDSSRIPRNEQKLEQWRRDLWQSTENSKAFVSGLFSQAQRALDQAVLACAQTIMNYSALAAGVSKNHFASAHLPLYPTAPILPPTPLPPSPFGFSGGQQGQQQQGQPGQPGGQPPFQSQSSFFQPQQQPSANYGTDPGQLPSQLNYGFQPGQQQNQQQQQQYGQQSPQSYQSSPQQQQQYAPQPQVQAQPQPQFMPQPQAQPQQPQGYAPQPQQQYAAQPQQQPQGYAPPQQQYAPPQQQPSQPQQYAAPVSDLTPPPPAPAAQ